ncbi:response regulator [Sorangium sp. So ce131]|uniref:response regulator n=1 Tax=Sorangium sp. So ce131 TaxID=3133282 RepID=UPI003F60171E
MNHGAILFVEDDPDDAHLTQRALRKAGINRPIVHVWDGEAALDYLFPQQGSPPELPAVVLLDLKLPKVGGAEVLRRIRADQRTRRLPVVVLTSSKERRDLEHCYDAGVSSYVCKPIGMHEFQEAVRSLGLYWLMLNEEPPA